MYQDRYSTLSNVPRPIVRGFYVFDSELSWSAEFDQALVDTGSDISLLPVRYYEQLRTSAMAAGKQLSAVGVRLTGIGGEERGVQQVSLSYRIPDLPRVQSAEFVLHKDFVVLGRNILNAFNIYLDGVPTGSHEAPTLRIDAI